MATEFLCSFARPHARTPFYISLAGITYPDINYHIKAQSRPLTVIEYVLNGEGYVLIDGKYEKVGADMIYLLNMGEHHDYFSDKSNPFTKIFLNISGSVAKELSSLYGLENEHLFICPELRPIFERIPKILRAYESEETTQTQLQVLLIEILTKLSYHRSRQNTNAEAIILKEYMDSNTDRIVSATELAKKIFRSVDYCQKLFLKEFGITPYAYQVNRKMLMAKNLLANTDMSVSAIGAALGYGDAHYFSNIFKSKIGCSPTSYRKEKTAHT